MRVSRLVQRQLRVDQRGDLAARQPRQQAFTNAGREPGFFLIAMAGPVGRQEIEQLLIDTAA